MTTLKGQVTRIGEMSFWKNKPRCHYMTKNWPSSMQPFLSKMLQVLLRAICHQAIALPNARFTPKCWPSEQRLFRPKAAR